MGMLFKALNLRNFGPYMGEQSMSFGVKSPIVLVHGPNMAGKTSLLNAVRWVLYGHALNRYGRHMPVMHLINTEATVSGDWVMSVKLIFEVDNVQYELERRVQPKNSNSMPRTNNDFDEKLFLTRNGRYLDAGEVQTEINRLLPEQISRFFLFDGELLNEYEALLSNESKQADIIKESIEHILGVPALVNSVADLGILLKDAAHRQQKLAAQDHKAHVYATEYSQIEARIAVYEEDLRELRSQRDSLSRRQMELDDILSAVADVEADVQRLQDYQLQVESLQEERSRLNQENRVKLVDAWKDLLQPKLRRRIAELSEEREKQISNVRNSEKLKSELLNIQKIFDKGICPVCGQRYHETQSVDLQTRKRVLEEELEELEVDEERLTSLSSSLKKLQAIGPANVIESIANNEKRLLHISVNLADLEQRVDDINERLKGHDKSDIARNRRDYVQVTKDLGVVEDKISKKEQEIDKLQKDASQIRAEIRKASGPVMQRLNREVQLYEDLISLFRAAVERLRDDLKISVEHDATDIFLHLTTDKAYKGLRINDHYGLSILDSVGREVQVRSAGAEQVVALSLIGALNRNAIRQGPIIMDTPFGRLDPKHRENILKFIPTMAEQVTLLVHGGEIERERDLQGIKDEIDREYIITHSSSHRSEIMLMESAEVPSLE